MQLIKTLIIAATALVSLSSSVLAADPKLNAFKTPGASAICKGAKLKSNGTQIRAGFCSSQIQGQIPAVDRMVSTLILVPRNGQKFVAGKNFTAEVAVRNFKTGFFSDAVNDYYDQAQTLDKNGVVQGHSHITIQKLSGSSVPDPTVFAFFKGLNLQAKGGKLTQVVSLPLPGSYRMCTMSSSFTHQPVIMPVAQRGAQDDCVRFTIVRK